jgi:hypothetical protein
MLSSRENLASRLTGIGSEWLATIDGAPDLHRVGHKADGLGIARHLEGHVDALAVGPLRHHLQNIAVGHLTAAWTAQQIVNAFPDDSVPSYLLRDRDQVYGQQVRHPVQRVGIDEVLTAPHSPWQNLSPTAGSVRSAARVSTTFSCSANDTYAES